MLKNGSMLTCMCSLSVQEPAKRAAFLALMPALRGRHQYALRSGKGWQGSCARAADGDKTTPFTQRAYVYSVPTCESSQRS